MAQIMKSNMLAPSVFQDELQSAPYHAGCDGAVLLHRGREHPARVYRLFMSIWTDAAAVERWRGVVRHRMSQKEGREQLFESCRITACSGRRTYTMTDRVQAPQYSNVFLRCKS